MIYIEFHCFHFVLFVHKIARYQQTIRILPHPKLSRIIWSIKTQYRVDLFDAGGAKQDLQAATVSRFSFSRQQSRFAYDNAVAVKPDSVCFWQPTDSVRRKKVEGPQSCDQNGNNRNSAQCSKAFLLMH